MVEIKRGDLFQLGKHRLLCGDATSLVDVQKLMDGKVAEMLFCDPPYNIHYSSQWRSDWRNKKDGTNNQVYGEIMHDFDFNYEQWFRIMETGIVKGSFYITNIPKNFTVIYDWLNKYCKRDTTLIIWLKNNHTLSRTDYHHLHELIFFNRKPEGVWNGGRDQKDIWFVKQRNVNTYLHPTQKPLRLVQKAILNSSNPGDIVMDPFGGSGSTLIASEQNERICYSMELDPKYCETIINRWQELTKKGAVKL